MKKKTFLSLLALFTILFSGCSSYEQFQQLAEEAEIPSKVYKTSYNQTWQAVLEIMQKYDIALKNQEAGVIKTRWIDNTNQLNFNEAFGSQDMVKAARFKIVINVIKGFRGTREVSKVSVFKRQMVEKDFLQGWKVVRTDGIREKTILYRIDRILKRELMIKSIEEKKAKEEQASF
ncbi:outer membrane protein assembly factor BamC [Bacteriovorax sp. DB6_IX]|uniref:outer membrane protein assembly factor BamC n=1 Tax=Bacteriovorax sp. DB6_IX TaxID=1353530 RepID=UPI00038A430A|nr:outer membrane protein assembly factor BamC [Bacteriovorax sp. DB6_IX]EQC52379.1 putative lipoprotein [Bacteriovorax sp. DB6_IX]